MTGLALLHHGLDVSLPLEPPAPDRGAAGTPPVPRHVGGRPVEITSGADRTGLEWALRLADPVIALTIGPLSAVEPLGLALARGAARAVRIWDEALVSADLAAMARVLAAAVERLRPDLVLAGARGLAGSTGMLPALLAARLGWPAIEGALAVGRDAEEVVAVRALPGGRREEVVAAAPVVVTVTADSVEPRYVSVRARRAATALGHDAWTLADLGLTTGAVRAAVRVRLEGLDWPRPRARRTAAPAPARTAAERMRQLVGGGRPAAPAPSATAPARVEGDPGEAAERILAFLATHGFL